MSLISQNWLGLLIVLLLLIMNTLMNLTVEMEKIKERCMSELEEVFKDADHHSCEESWEDNKCD